MPLTIPRNEFKANLTSGKKQVGFWLTLASPSATEIAAEAGFDWLLIDMEHSPNDLTDVIHHLRAATRGTAEPIVRVPELNATMVKRLLDAGARTLMFPNIQNADQARAAVAATRYPPTGIRGVAGTTRGGWYGRSPNYLHEADKEICVVLQLETPEAIQAATEIGNIDGVDALFIGPNDLAANMGHLGDPQAAVVRAKIDEGLALIRQTGKAVGILEFNPDAAQQYFLDGFNFIAVGGDGSILAKQTSELAKKFKV